MLDTEKVVVRRCKVCQKELEIIFTENDRKEGGQGMFCYCGTLLWIPCNKEENVRVMLHHS